MNEEGSATRVQVQARLRWHCDEENAVVVVATGGVGKTMSDAKRVVPASASAGVVVSSGSGSSTVVRVGRWLLAGVRVLVRSYKEMVAGAGKVGGRRCGDGRRRSSDCGGCDMEMVGEKEIRVKVLVV